MNNFIFIIIILLLVLCIILYKNKKKKEHFIADIYNEPILKINVTDTKIPQINIYKNEQDTSIKFDNLNKFDKSILIKSVDDFDLIDKAPYNLYYTDVYTFNKYYKDDYKAVSLCTIPKSLMFVSKSNIPDLTTKYLRIGYTNEIDKIIAKNIIKSQTNFLSINNYEFILTNNVTEDLFNLNNIDIFVYFNTLSNPLFNEIKTNDFNLVSYNDVNKDLFEYYFPFYRKKIYTIEKSVDKNVIYNTLQIDTIIFTTKEVVDFNKNYLKILEYFDEYLKINYYLQYFDFTKISKDWSLGKQDNIKELIETFEDGEKKDTGLLFIISETINSNERLNFQNAEIVSNDNIIIYRVTILNINNIPINENDRFIFTYNIGDFEVNKLYYVSEIEDNSILIEDSKKIELNDEIINIDSNYIKLTDKTIKKYSLEYGDSVYVMKYGKGIIIKSGESDDNDIDKDIYVLLDEKKEVPLGGEYVNINIRESCVADQLIGGTGSDIGLVDDIYQVDKKSNEQIEDLYQVEQTFNEKNIREWDSRCVENEECPFYLKNKNYPNTRGGCINGYCEFPIGLKRISYTKYYDVINENNYPRCEGCADTDNIFCCDEQGVDNDNFKGPNYIFSRNKDMVS
jgi:hypothetical protein